MPLVKTTTVAVSRSTSGDGTAIVAAAAGYRIRLHGGVLIAAGDVSMKWKDGASTDLTGAMPLTTNGGFTCPMSEKPWMETTAGNALILNLSDAVLVAGWIAYSVVKE